MRRRITSLEDAEGPRERERAVEKEYPLDFGRFKQIAIAPLVFAVFCMGTSLYLSLQPWVDTVMLRGLGVALPFLLGASIVTYFISAVVNRNEASLIISPDTLIYRKGLSEVRVPWRQATERDMETTTLRASLKMRRFRVTDGANSITIEELFLPRYEVLSKIIFAAVQKGISME